MNLGKITRTFKTTGGAAYANYLVTFAISKSNIPARLYSSTGALLSESGEARTDSNGVVTVYVDQASLYKITLREATTLAEIFVDENAETSLASEAQVTGNDSGGGTGGTVVGQFDGGRTILWDYERDGIGALSVVSGSCTIVGSTLNGVPCVKITGTSAGGTTYTRISLGSTPITLTGGVGMDCAAERANTTQLTARIGPGSSVPDYASASLNPTAASNTSFWTYNDVQEYSIQAFPNGTGFAYGGTWTTPPTYPIEAGYAEVRANAVAGQIPVWYLRRVYSMAPRVSRVALVLDDGYATAYRLLKPVLESYKLRASWAIIPSEIDGGTALFMKWADVANLFDQGHEIVTHGITTVSGAGSVGAFMATVRAQRQRIRDLGFSTTASDRCYVWPGGEHQSATNDTAYRDAMRAEGFVIARGAMPHTIAWTADTIPEPLVLPIMGHQQAASSGAEATNITAIVAAINQAAAVGSDVILMNHAGVPSTDTSWGSNGGLNIRTTDYATICAAIRANVLAGSQTCVHFSGLM